MKTDLISVAGLATTLVGILMLYVYRVPPNQNSDGSEYLYTEEENIIRKKDYETKARYNKTRSTIGLILSIVGAILSFLASISF